MIINNEEQRKIDLQKIIEHVNKWNNSHPKDNPKAEMIVIGRSRYPSFNDFATLYHIAYGKDGNCVGIADRVK